MSWRLVHLADVAPARWRNGAGLTRELAAWPAVGDWRWRMSVAEVGQSGPFSRFEGVARWFAVLQGSGVQLDVAGQRQRLTASEPPFLFNGAATTNCQLLDGATQDFNLMLRTGHGAGAQMVRVTGSVLLTVAAPKTIAVYAIDAGASVLFNDEPLYLPPATLIWRTVQQDATLRLSAANALWMEIAA